MHKWILSLRSLFFPPLHTHPNKERKNFSIEVDHKLFPKAEKGKENLKFFILCNGNRECLSEFKFFLNLKSLIESLAFG